MTQRGLAHLLRLAAALLALALAPAALAHKPSDSYLTLRIENATIHGQWDIALRDLEETLGLDADQDGVITWRELRAQHEAIAAFALARLALEQDCEPCAMRPVDHLVDDHSDGGYAVQRFEAGCAISPTALAVTYRLFFETDPQHRGLLRLEQAGATRSAIFTATSPRQTFALGRTSGWRTFGAYVAEGVWHIWFGFDHVLFLLSLLLPAVLTRSDDGRWRGAQRFAPALLDVVRIVTAFTIAHSITLTLAALGVVTLPSRLVEAAIAASVVLAALNNLAPLVARGRWAFAFGFGLVHGFGFANVLADLGLPRGSLLLALLGFNLGVELGQLVVVAAFLPLAWTVRRTWVYRAGVMTWGSLAVLSIATLWLVERALDLRLLAG